jgi:hypothetical protein
MDPVRALVVGEALWDLRAPRGRAFVDAPSLALEAGGGAAARVESDTVAVPRQLPSHPRA